MDSPVVYSFLGLFSHLDGEAIDELEEASAVEPTCEVVSEGAVDEPLYLTVAAADETYTCEDCLVD